MCMVPIQLIQTVRPGTDAWFPSSWSKPWGMVCMRMVPIQLIQTARPGADEWFRSSWSKPRGLPIQLIQTVRSGCECMVPPNSHQLIQPQLKSDADAWFPSSWSKPWGWVRMHMVVLIQLIQSSRHGAYAYGSHPADPTPTKVWVRMSGSHPDDPNREAWCGCTGFPDILSISEPYHNCTFGPEDKARGGGGHCLHVARDRDTKKERLKERHKDRDR